ncbi:large subunit ribosomal protein L22 [Ilumatobacter fluminis]|uniref:Large ribosomal subunit protein uL22 n=1 Tax=Ilumatobacter fluminis TaxID=467091 RepID=A0A4R7HYM2_9ACTN|nr:large subunit ribosomal protein L22 [Ilumatobacter fluminis]
MRGPKLNEGATAIGERHGTKATAKYVRSSAYKARVVLDLIRGLPVHQADEVLQFTDRAIAHDIRKVLASAVANATDTDSGAYIADADELFVLACFADEGPTLRRFRPRARGRATRIRKRTCHITIVVARMSEDRLEVVQARAEGRSSSQSANRRARVERSRQRAEQAKAGVDQIDADEAETDAIEDENADDIATDEVEGFAGVEETEVETVEVDAAEVDAADDADEAPAASGDFEAAEWAGSIKPDVDGNGPDTHPIKGNADSMLYHTPDSRYYKVTKAEVWFDTEENAEAAGFSKPGSKKDED